MPDHTESMQQQSVVKPAPQHTAVRVAKGYLPYMRMGHYRGLLSGKLFYVANNKAPSDIPHRCLAR